MIAPYGEGNRDYLAPTSSLRLSSVFMISARSRRGSARSLSRVRDLALARDHNSLLARARQLSPMWGSRSFRPNGARVPSKAIPRRSLAHPQTRDRSRFDVIVEAHNTLRDPVRRAQYDINFHVQSSARLKLADEVNSTKIWQDTDLQNKLLSVLFVKCRQNVHDPGVDHLELERLTRCPTEHLEFHLWYLREKGWVKRTESGRLAITVEGVDRVNSQHERKATNNLLSDQSHV